MAQMRRKRVKPVCGGSAMLKEQKNIESGVIERKPKMQVRMKRYEGRLVPIMFARGGVGG